MKMDSAKGTPHRQKQFLESHGSEHVPSQRERSTDRSSYSTKSGFWKRMETPTDKRSPRLFISSGFECELWRFRICRASKIESKSQIFGNGIDMLRYTPFGAQSARLPSAPLYSIDYRAARQKQTNQVGFTGKHQRCPRCLCLSSWHIWLYALWVWGFPPRHPHGAGADSPAAPNCKHMCIQCPVSSDCQSTVISHQSTYIYIYIYIYKYIYIYI